MIQNIDALFLSTSSRYDLIQLTPDYLTLVKNSEPTRSFIVIKVSVIKSIKKGFINFEPNPNVKKSKKRTKNANISSPRGTMLLSSDAFSTPPGSPQPADSETPFNTEPVSPIQLGFESPTKASLSYVGTPSRPLSISAIEDSFTAAINSSESTSKSSGIMVCIEGGEFQFINPSRMKMFIGQVEESTVNNLILRINQIRCFVRLQSNSRLSSEDALSQLKDFVEKSRKFNASQNESSLKKLLKQCSKLEVRDLTLIEEQRFKEAINYIRQEQMETIDVNQEIIETSHWDLYTGNSLSKATIDHEIQQMDKGELNISQSLEYVYPTIGKILKVIPNVRILEKFDSMHGVFVLTSNAYFFIPSAEGKARSTHLKKLYINQIRTVLKQRFVTKEVALEIFTHSTSGVSSVYQTSHFFVFDSMDDRDAVISISPLKEKVEDVSKSIATAQEFWINGLISNFEYILFLNQRSGRTIHDISQYPIFPWILQDYKSSKLDLSDPHIYRDLSKPVGATNPERLQNYLTRAEENNYSHLYTTHYSTPGYISYFLTRTHPELILSLQSGTYDVPDRLFKDIHGAYLSSYSNPSDVKELIPEFFDGDGAFLKNIYKLSLGVTNEGQIQVDDVVLPPWASSAEEFIKIHRAALESTYVSQNLHKWIDLVFGYYQRPPKASEAHNTFPNYMYEGPEVLVRENNYDESTAILQVYEFGHMPRFLFSQLHPKRNTPLDIALKQVSDLTLQLNEQIQENIDQLANLESIEFSLREQEAVNSSLSTELQEKSDIIASLQSRIEELEESVRQQSALEGKREACATCSVCSNCTDHPATEEKVKIKKVISKVYVLPPQVVNEINSGAESISQEAYIINLERNLNQLMQDNAKLQQQLDSELEKNYQKEKRINRIRDENDELTKVIQHFRNTHSTFILDDSLKLAKLELENEKLNKALLRRRQEAEANRKRASPSVLQSPLRLIPKQKYTPRAKKLNFSAASNSSMSP